MDYNVTYRQKDGGWQYIISFKQNGQWKQKSKQGFKTRSLAKKAADTRLDELKENFELKKNILPEYEGIAFKEFMDMYVAHESLYKSRNTILTYTSLSKYFLKLNDLPIDKITSIDIQSCVDQMVKKNLSPKTIKLYTTRLGTIFNNAIKPHKIITENPVSDVILPTIPSQNKEDKIKALSKTELESFFKKLQQHTNEHEYLSSLLAATCGLRMGEILGLTWNNIDFKKSVLKVDKQWKRLKSGMGLGTPKSNNSYREIPVPNKTLKKLEEYKKDNPTDINNRVILYKSASSLTWELPKKYRKAGYDITIHILRHTYATNLLANGLDFKTVARLMGHDVEQTFKTYSHVTDDMIQRAAQVVNSVF